MNLSQGINRFLTGLGLTRSAHNAPATSSECPVEDRIVSYAEGRLTPDESADLERHMSDCADCRELLALFAYVSTERAKNPEEFLKATPDLEAKDQTARVLNYIKEDEFRLSQAAAGAGSGFFVSSRLFKLAAALAISAIVGISAVWIMNRQTADEVAMQALAQAMERDRRIPLRISGEFNYAPYTTTRGDAETGDVNLDIAFNKLKFAEKESAPAKDRLTLARVYLAAGTRVNAARARKILEEIEAGGLRSAEMLNDKGVALFLLDNYDSAVAAFTSALKKDPGLHHALFNRAFVHYYAGQHNKARQDWEEFINSAADSRWKDEARYRLSKLPEPETSSDP